MQVEIETLRQLQLQLSVTRNLRELAEYFERRKELGISTEESAEEYRRIADTATAIIIVDILDELEEIIRQNP
jgi:hypothetical protein